MTYPCPHCGFPANLETGCSSCHRGPDPDAAEVIRADAEITTLIAELATARTAVQDLELRIGQAWQRRHAAAARVRAATGLPPRPETSSRAVQNLLFTLGGLLLGVAAIVFTAVLWSQYGTTGRAVLLAAVTVVALAVPPFALRRGLRATAETMAAVGVLLTLLCGFAAWSVDLFGVDDWSAARYTGVICLLTAAIAAGYALVTGLRGPRWQALLIFQPALPLLVLSSHSGPAAWSLTFGAVAAVDLVARRARVAPVAYACAAPATLLAALPAAISGFRTLEAARPFFHAPWLAAVPAADWRLPVALVAVTAALFGAVPPRLRPASLTAGATALALSLPAGLHLPWWTGPLIDLPVVAAILAPSARRARTALPAPAALATALLLTAHALTASFGRPAVAAGTLLALSLIGAGLAIRAQHPALAGAGLFTALVTLPPIAWTGTAALALTPATQTLSVTAAAALALLLIAVADAPAGLLARPAVLAQAPSLAGWAAIVPLGMTLLAVLPGLTPGIGTAVVLGVLLAAGAAVGAAAGTPAARGLGVAVAVAVGLDATLTRPAGTVLEAYAMVASVLALAAALLARREHSSSWTLYGPALVIGLTPSLVSVLANDGQHLRRLLLGTAALAILLAGAKARQRTPLVAGGATLAVVALHELVLVCELIPRWIPLAAGGLLLVLLATTLEARRRDLTRFRHAIGRMS